MAASATFALKAGVWFRRGRLIMVSPDSQATACPPSGRNSTYRPVQISGASSGGVEEFEEFDEFAAAMTVPDQGMNLAAEKVDAGQTVCPSLKRPTHPRCYGEGYPDWPGRASNKEGESWASIAGLSLESIRQSCAMPLRLLRRGVEGRSSRQGRSLAGCKSPYRQLPVIGRLAYPMRGEVTN